jgi:heme exporter protein D
MQHHLLPFSSLWFSCAYVGGLLIMITIICAVVRARYLSETETLRTWALGLFATGLIPAVNYFFPIDPLLHHLLLATLVGTALYLTIFNDLFYRDSAGETILSIITSSAGCYYIFQLMRWVIRDTETIPNSLFSQSGTLRPSVFADVLAAGLVLTLCMLVRLRASFRTDWLKRWSDGLSIPTGSILAVSTIAILCSLMPLEHGLYHLLIALCCGPILYLVLFDDKFSYNSQRLIGVGVIITGVLYLFVIAQQIGGASSAHNDIAVDPFPFSIGWVLVGYIGVLALGTLMIVFAIAKEYFSDASQLWLWACGLVATGSIPLCQSFLPVEGFWWFVFIATIVGAAMYLPLFSEDQNYLPEHFLGFNTSFAPVFYLLNFGTRAESIISIHNQLKPLAQIAAIVLLLALPVVWWRVLLFSRKRSRRKYLENVARKQAKENQLEAILLRESSAQDWMAALKEVGTEEFAVRILKNAEKLSAARAMDEQNLTQLRRELLGKLRSSSSLREASEILPEGALKTLALERLVKAEKEAERRAAEEKFRQLRASASRLGIGCPFYNDRMCGPAFSGDSRSRICNLAKGNYGDCFTLPVLLHKRNQHR